MSIGHKASVMQTFRLMVYQRALHPELFDLQGRRMYRHGDYEAEIWVYPLGHVVRFQIDGQCLTETVIQEGDHLPEHGLVHALPCLGEKEFELQPTDSTDSIGYVTTVQTEALTDNLYLTTYREMMDFAKENDALCHDWLDETGADNLSVLDVQKFQKEFHFQSYHLINSCNMVLRTQSIFESI